MVFHIVPSITRPGIIHEGQSVNEKLKNEKAIIQKDTEVRLLLQARRQSNNNNGIEEPDTDPIRSSLNQLVVKLWQIAQSMCLYKQHMLSLSRNIQYVFPYSDETQWLALLLHSFYLITLYATGSVANWGAKQCIQVLRESYPPIIDTITIKVWKTFIHNEYTFKHENNKYSMEQKQQLKKELFNRTFGYPVAAIDFKDKKLTETINILEFNSRQKLKEAAKNQFTEEAKVYFENQNKTGVILCSFTNCQAVDQFRSNQLQQCIKYEVEDDCYTESDQLFCFASTCSTPLLRDHQLTLSFEIEQIIVHSMHFHLLNQQQKEYNSTKKIYFHHKLTTDEAPNETRIALPVQLAIDVTLRRFTAQDVTHGQIKSETNDTVHIRHQCILGRGHGDCVLKNDDVNDSATSTSTSAASASACPYAHDQCPLGCSARCRSIRTLRPSVMQLVLSYMADRVDQDLSHSSSSEIKSTLLNTIK